MNLVIVGCDLARHTIGSVTRLRSALHALLTRSALHALLTRSTLQALLTRSALHADNAALDLGVVTSEGERRSRRIQFRGRAASQYVRPGGDGKG